MQAQPTVLHIFPTALCNISCVMCEQDHTRNDQEMTIYLEELRRLLPFARTVTAVGGEPLMSRAFRDFVRDFDPSSYPDCKFEMVSNGLLLDRNFLALMPGRFRWVGISVDGATAATYERIRVGGRWDRLMCNLRALEELQGRDFPVTILFTMMRPNFSELPQMCELAIELGIELSALPIHGDWPEQFDQPDEVEAVLRILDRVASEYDCLRLGGVEGTRRFYENTLLRMA